MKKEAKTKKITIDKLAVMVANGFESIEAKMATKEDLNSQKLTINRVDKKLTKHEQVLQLMLKEITVIHEDTKSFRDNISTLYTDHIAYDRKIDNLTVRVEKLEIKK